MGKTAQIRARTDSATKEQAEEILDELGLTPSAAINMFYRQIVMRRSLPFNVEVPNATTAKAIAQARAGDDLVEAENLSELLETLLSKRERSFDVADLVESDPHLLEVAERIARVAG